MSFFLRDIVVRGVKVVVSAFGQAYNHIAYGKAQGAPDAAKAGMRAVDRALRRGMTINEARQVLDIKETTPIEEINEKFEKMYFANSVDNNGSFYIQSKFYRAKQAIDHDLAEKAKLMEDEKGFEGKTQ